MLAKISSLICILAGAVIMIFLINKGAERSGVDNATTGGIAILLFGMSMIIRSLK